MSSTDKHSPGLRSALRRFSTVVIVCTIVGGAIAALASYRTAESYVSDALYLVPPGTGPSAVDGITPFDAERLARTYAVVLAEDAQVLSGVGDAVGRDADDVADRIVAVALPSSSAIRVSYTGASRGEAVDALGALTDLVERSDAASPNLRPDTLRLLQPPARAVRSGGGTLAAPLAGGIAGLLLGLAGAALLARTSPRVESAADLREAGGPSVVEVDLASQRSIEALAVRMLDGCPEGAWVAVVSATAEDSALVDRLTGGLSDATGAIGAQQSLGTTTQQTTWLPAPLGGGRGERAAQDADRTLLVVPTGAPLRAVAARLADLRDLGVRDVVVCVLREGSGGDRPETAVSNPVAVRSQLPETVPARPGPGRPPGP